MEILKSCPICDHPVTQLYLSASDHFLTKERFTIVQCVQCGFRFLNPRPGSQEIASYYESPEYTSHNAQKKNLFNFIYKTIRNQSIRNKYRIIRRHTPGKNLLDIGCGTGEFIAWCKKKGMTVTGIEPNEKARDFATNENDITVFPESELKKMLPGTFDIITLWHVLEHVHDLNERMTKILELLKPSGLLVVAVPNSDSRDALQYGEYWAAYDLPRHLYHFTASSMTRLTQKHGFSMVERLPMKWDAYYISLLSEKYRTGSRNLFPALLNGFLSNVAAAGKDVNYSSQVFILKRQETAK